MFQNIRVVMVHTTHPGNIGAAARALKTMGLSKLVLVAPKEFPSPRAQWRAAGAVEVIENAEVVESLEEAVKDCSMVVGTSARLRRIPWPVLDARSGGEVIAKQAATEQVALVFGREDRGLTNEELQMCNYHIEIPANHEYGVLNVASAVQIICYEVRMSILSELKSDRDVNTCPNEDPATENAMPVEIVRWDERLATTEEMQHFFKHLERVLTQLDFYEPDNPRQLLTRLRRLFLRSRLDQLEINILRGVLTAVQRKTGNQ